MQVRSKKKHHWCGYAIDNSIFDDLHMMQLSTIIWHELHSHPWIRYHELHSHPAVLCRELHSHRQLILILILILNPSPINYWWQIVIIAAKHEDHIPEPIVHRYFGVAVVNPSSSHTGILILMCSRACASSSLLGNRRLQLHTSMGLRTLWINWSTNEVSTALTRFVSHTVPEHNCHHRRKARRP